VSAGGGTARGETLTIFVLLQSSSGMTVKEFWWSFFVNIHTLFQSASFSDRRFHLTVMKQTRVEESRTAGALAATTARQKQTPHQ
jgi:hypothetical protein